VLTKDKVTQCIYTALHKSTKPGSTFNQYVPTCQGYNDELD